MLPLNHNPSTAIGIILSGVSCCFAVVCSGAGETDLAAVNALGKRDTALLQLVREVTEWKARAEAAESLLTKAGLSNNAVVQRNENAQARVLASLESERVLILSAGKLSGAVLGALVSVGEGVVAKVVESRDTVSAALVDQKYQGKVGALEGSHVRLLVVRS